MPQFREGAFVMLRSTIAFLVLTMLQFSGANAQERWELLGSKSVELEIGKVSIDTTAAKGRYRAVRLVFRGGGATISRVTVIYSDGRSLEENREINLVSGERTRSIAPLEEDRFIDHVDIFFEPKQGAKTGTFEAWGLQLGKAAADTRLPDEKLVLASKASEPIGDLNLPVEVRKTVFEATNRTRTVMLGERMASAGAPGNISVSNARLGALSSVQLRIADADLYVEDLILIRADGQREDLAINAEIKAGKQTDWLALKAPGSVSEILINYRPPASGKSARIAVVGELASAATIVLASVPSASVSSPTAIYTPTAAAAKLDCVQANSCTAIHIHFGTNRERKDRPELSGFGPQLDPTNKLSLGLATVTVPKGHQVTGYEVPSEWLKWLSGFPGMGGLLHYWTKNPDKYIAIPDGGIHVFINKDEFINSMKTAMEKQQYKDHAFIYVHGFNTTFEHALYRTAQIAYDLGSGAPDNKIPFDVPFLFSWPSRGQPDPSAYSADGDDARTAAKSFAEFVQLIKTQSGAKHLHLIAHSMGNEALMAMLKVLKLEDTNGKIFDQLVLAAPDVYRGLFVIEMEPLVESVANAVTLYASSNDAAIILSRRGHAGEARAGDVPSDLGPVSTLAAEQGSKNGNEPLSNFYPIDVSRISTGIFSFEAHNAYVSSRELLDDMGELLRSGRQPPSARYFRIYSVPCKAADAVCKSDPRRRYWVHPGK